MKYLIVVVAIFLSGCDVGQAPWQLAPLEYSCDNTEMVKVENETRFCNENTTYRATYCYGTAIIRNCQIIESSLD